MASRSYQNHNWRLAGYLMISLVGFATPPRPAAAITITLDYTLDERNENWFDPTSATGLARRAAVDSAAGFLSAVITNDDWQPLSSLNEALTYTDIAAATIKNLTGETLIGTAESDGRGFAYDSASNDVDVTNRSSVAANEYVVYVGAFAFDSGTTANAKASWDSSDRRNSAGAAGAEFNTWGGKIYFNTAKTWYFSSNPGADPTDNYGVQDDDKNPTTDVSTDNWDWSTSSDSWKGFDLRTIDPTAAGRIDLYATALHELMHALGATTSVIEDYVGVAANGDFIGPHLVETYGGPVPGDGGHFAANTQSLVWATDDIVSEAVLDPSSLSGVRKYLTKIDTALLRDLGYQVLASFAPPILAGDYNDDGLVDAIDYAVWRDALGSDLEAADGDGSGEVDAADFAIWAANYGASSSPESLAASAVASLPEPTTAALLLIGLWFAARAETPRRRGG